MTRSRAASKKGLAPWVERNLERSRRIYESHGTLFRIAWVLVAVAIVVIGLAMMILPGPATVVVPVGLLMLAAAFSWARRLVRVGARKSVEAGERMSQLGTRAKVFGVLAVACVAAAVIAAVATWSSS